MERHIRSAEAAASLSGSNEDDTIGTSGTVDCRRRSILKYRDGLDVLRTDVIKVGNCVNHTIHYDKRLV